MSKQKCGQHMECVSETCEKWESQLAFRNLKKTTLSIVKYSCPSKPAGREFTG